MNRNEFLSDVEARVATPRILFNSTEAWHSPEKYLPETEALLHDPRVIWSQVTGWTAWEDGYANLLFQFSSEAKDRMPLGIVYPGTKEPPYLAKPNEAGSWVPL